MKEDSKIWLEEANWDLENAEILFRSNRFNTAVFQSQQASEKAVKSLLFSRNLNGWGHSTSRLLEKYKELTHQDISEVINDALQLDKHYIPTRYPDALPGIAPHKAYTRQEAENSIKQAKRIINFVKEELLFFEEQEKPEEN